MLLFRLKKQTRKNVVDTTFKHCFTIGTLPTMEPILYYSKTWNLKYVYKENQYLKQNFCFKPKAISICKNNERMSTTWMLKPNLYWKRQHFVLPDRNEPYQPSWFNLIHPIAIISSKSPARTLGRSLGIFWFKGVTQKYRSIIDWKWAKQIRRKWVATAMSHATIKLSVQRSTKLFCSSIDTFHRINQPFLEGASVIHSVVDTPISTWKTW